MYPGVEDVWTDSVCERGAVIFQIFKTHISSKAKKRYGHSFWMTSPALLHEARVIAHATVHLYQGVDARVSSCGKQARDSSPAPIATATVGQ